MDSDAATTREPAESQTASAEVPLRRIRLQGLRLKNFRCFRDTEFSLEPLTVIVGPNGAGKSSLLRALTLLPWAVNGGLSRVISDRGGGVSMFSFGQRSMEIGLGVDLLDPDGAGDQYLEHSLRLSKSRQRSLGYRVTSEQVRAFAADEPTLECRTKRAGSAWLELRRSVGGLAEFSMSGATRSPDTELPSSLDLGTRWSAPYLSAYGVPGAPGTVRMDPSSTTLFREGQGSRGWLEREASSFLSTLFQVFQKDPDRIVSERRKQLVQSARELLPWLDDILSKREIDGFPRLMLVEQGNELHPRHVSEGTLMLLGRLTALTFAPSVLLVDEPEVHLHPAAISKLVRMYRSVVEDPSEPIQQVIISTQSPAVVRQTRPSELRIVERSREGAAVFGATADADSLSARLERAGLDIDEAWLSGYFGGIPGAYEPEPSDG